MDKDIREMTLGEIEDLILKQYNKVETSQGQALCDLQIYFPN